LASWLVLALGILAVAATGGLREKVTEYLEDGAGATV